MRVWSCTLIMQDFTYFRLAIVRRATHRPSSQPPVAQRASPAARVHASSTCTVNLICIICIKLVIHFCIFVQVSIGTVTKRGYDQTNRPKKCKVASPYIYWMGIWIKYTTNVAFFSPYEYFQSRRTQVPYHFSFPALPCRDGMRNFLYRDVFTNFPNAFYL